MSQFECPECGGTDTIAVWEDFDRWVDDKEPHFIACHDCHMVVE